jgi:hypothetical protein
MNLRKYKVWWPEQGQTKDDARVFDAFDHEDAAAAWADWYDGYSADLLRWWRNRNCGKNRLPTVPNKPPNT